jgi:uncharacterized protein (AIM24 family)
MTRDGERRPGASDEGARDTGLDEDFLYHVRRGTELLAAGKNEEARDELERAAHLRPGNLKAHNLLGLTLFKLGLFDRAIETYERLIQESPKDATLRINLGLVHLKAGQTGEAVAQLETAVDLVPDRPKALNYLGLAYAQARELDKAKRVFERSGNTAMVRRMAAALRGDAEASELDPVSGSDLAPMGLEMNNDTVERRAMKSSTNAGEATTTMGNQRFGPNEPLGLTDLVRETRYEPAGTGPMEIDDIALTLHVEGELRARLPHLLWIRGELIREGETKRFRGRTTEQPFGEGDDLVFHLRGSGVVALSPAGSVFTTVGLRDDAVYLVESSILAFETSLAYENGRLPGGSFADLALIHLRGKGKALIRSSGPIRSLVVEEGEPVQIPVETLVGWLGNLTPALSGTGQSCFVSLEGEGWALWTTPPAK